MASVVDSIRSVYQDNFALLKLGFFSYIIYLIVNMIVPSDTFNFINFILCFILFYIFLGYCCIIMSNRINQRIETLPKFDPITFFNVATKALLISIPFLIIGYFVVNFVVGLFNFEGVPQLIAIWIIRFFIFAILITALINFSEKYELKAGFNASSIVAGVADVLVYTILCLIIIAIYSIFIALPTLYLIYNFFEIGPLFKYVAVFFVIMNLTFMSDYWGQLHFDIESKNNYY